MESFAQSVTSAATLASAHPIVEATKFPSNGAGWLDWIFGLLQGGYVPITMHRQHDCYSQSVYALDWFVSTHKVWKYNYSGNDFKAGTVFEAVFEPIFALASGADAVMTCLGTQAWWAIAMEEMKAEWEAEKAAGDEDEEDEDADAEEGDEPAEEEEDADEYGEEFRAMLKQYGDEYGDEEEAAEEGAEEEDADEEDEDDEDEDEKKDRHPGDWLVWWDVGVHGLDLGWSIWKAIDVYGTGIYHYDGGRYLGRMAADTYCILDWILNRKELTPYWNEAMDLYMAAAEERKAQKEAEGDEDGDDDEDAEDDADAGEEGEEEAEDESEYGDDY